MFRPSDAYPLLGRCLAGAALVFSGLAMLGSGRIAQSNTDDRKDGQPSSWEAAVYVKGARNVVLENCRIADTGG